MTDHTPPVSEGMLRALPSKVSRAMQLVLLTVGIASTIISIAGEWSHGHHFLNQWLVENVSVLGAVLNLVLIALALFPGRIQPLTEEANDRTVRSLARCINIYSLRSVTLMWMFFGLLYVVILFQNTFGTHGRESLRLATNTGPLALLPATLIELLSSGSTAAIACCYISLTPKFLGNYVATRNQPELWNATSHFRNVLIAIVAVGCAAAALHLALPRSLFGDPNKVDLWATLLNGVVSAVALGYLVGRLDSKFISNWQWVIPPLFAYAGLQVYIPALEKPHEIMAAMFTYSAFTMKCVLYIFLSNLFETRRILYYAVELVQLEKDDV